MFDFIKTIFIGSLSAYTIGSFGESLGPNFKKTIKWISPCKQSTM